MCHSVPVVEHRLRWVVVTRAEHRHRTLLALSDAATATFEELGPQASIEQVAERAGMARRTVYRWVESRDDLVFIHPRLWLEYFDEAVSEVVDQPMRERVLHGIRRVSEAIDADPGRVTRAMTVALKNPELMRGHATVNQAWISRIAAEVHHDPTTRQERLRARVLGSAIMGAIDAALVEWLTSEPRPLLVDLVDEGLEHLAPILDVE